MFRLECELVHDSGLIENVSQRIGINVAEWRETFDYMVNVYCRVNTVELVPKKITILGDTYMVYDVQGSDFYTPEEEV